MKNPYAADAWLITRKVDQQEGLPLELFGLSQTLFFEQQIRVLDDAEVPGRKKCHTAAYRYRFQTATGEHLLRWEYDREPPRPDSKYPLAHVHVHGTLDRITGGLKGLHIATGRVPFESVFRHLIADWGVKPKSPEWETILDESLEGFYERRTRD